MNNLIILTSSFPYKGGEQFLETEIKYWEGTSFDNVYIIPATNKGTLRSFPSEIKLLKKHEINQRFLYVIKAALSVHFIKEVTYLIKKTKIKNWTANFKIALRSTAILLREKEALSNTMKYNYIKGNNTFYCYWNDMSFYAACILKEKGAINHVVSRSHNFDLYEERYTNNYMPLKRQFVNSYGKVYLLSKSALDYYQHTYDANFCTLDIARLGVNLPLKLSTITNEEYRLKVLSLSYCVPVKQIHLIMNALLEYSKTNNSLIIEWTHIGGGPLLETLKEKSRTIDSQHKNLVINFTGNLKNTDVIKTLDTNYFDLFINASSSEGIPVSIMEAMSYGIPAIAPNIGGIADLVNKSNGYLMPSNCSADDIVNGINTVYKNKDCIDFRSNAYNWVAENFNANINYPKFIKDLEKIAGANEPQ